MNRCRATVAGSRARSVVIGPAVCEPSLFTAAHFMVSSQKALVLGGTSSASWLKEPEKLPSSSGLVFKQEKQGLTCQGRGITELRFRWLKVCSPEMMHSLILDASADLEDS